MSTTFSRRSILFIVIVFLFAGPVRGQQHRVFEYVLRSVPGSVDEVGTKLADAAVNAGWQILSTTDAAAPDECAYNASVVALYNPDYARELMTINNVTAPFAVVDRINIFEDEDGLHVAVVNANSINRTVLMDDVAYAEMTAAHLSALRSMIMGAVDGVQSSEGFGQGRKRGYIGKTMGVMAGGKFADKIQSKLVLPAADFEAVTKKVKEGLAVEGQKWGLELAYELQLPEFDVVIFGSTGPAMESKSFSIVKAGSNKARKGFACPGLAHAGAYPIEVVVRADDENVEVQFVDAMYRMKMYFEDAGKMAFMKNMRMPGSLADELTNQIRQNFGDDIQ